MAHKVGYTRRNGARTFRLSSQRLVTTASKACQDGNFASARKPKANGVVEISTLCKRDKGSQAASYIVGRRASGGVVLMTIIGASQSPEAGEGVITDSGKIVTAGFGRLQ